MAEMMNKRRFSVGYALLEKKQKSLIQVSLMNASKQRGIDLIQIDSAKPLNEQGPFDCVIHKLSGDNWRKQLLEYMIVHPRCIVVDSLDAIQRLTNRISMLEVVSDIENVATASVGIPKQFAVYENERIELGDDLKFPVIAKPLIVDGTVKSHKMTLVFSKEGLENVRPPIVLQEFVNHGGVIFKVYVVGEYVKCVKRKSLEDISDEKLGSLSGSYSFCQVSNMNGNVKNDESYYKVLEKAEMPPTSLINYVARGLRKALKLHLFNFDVIRDTRVGNRYLVVDINYFPGYAKMPGYESVLTDFFYDVLTNEKVRSFGIQKEGKKAVENVGGCGEENGRLPVQQDPFHV